MTPSWIKFNVLAGAVIFAVLLLARGLAWLWRWWFYGIG